MPKTRLTQADREAIANAIIAHKFGPIEVALKVEENVLAEEVRVHSSGDFLKTMERAPKGAFATASHVTVTVDGCWHRLYFGGTYPNAVERRVFNSHYRDKSMKVLAGDALGDRVASWAERVNAASVERAKLFVQTKGTLSNFRSFDDLLEAWPEAERFITENWRNRPAVAGVPAISFKALTEALDLPPDTETQPIGKAA